MNKFRFLRDNGGNSASAQDKIISVNDALGNDAIKMQQGTTRIVYDTLPCDARIVYEFFKNSQQRPFPLSNVGSFGNKLEVGEALCVLNYYLSYIEYDPATGIMSQFETIEFFPNLIGGQLSLEVGNNVVMKPIPVSSSITGFNRDASFQDLAMARGAVNFHFRTKLIIPPMLEYCFKYEIPNALPVTNKYLRLTIEGVGSIVNVRHTL